MDYRKLTTEENFTELNRRHLDTLVRKYIKLKAGHEKARGTPNRFLLKNDYRALVDELFATMPDNYEIDGKVLVKGHNPVLNKLYIQVFTKESFTRTKTYSGKRKIKTTP